jgi:translation initiation factor 2-alpha kinase 4
VNRVYKETDRPLTVFADSKGDCKLGDFGLATSSLEPEQSEGQPKATTGQGLLTVPKLIGVELTLEVGTRLYIAPEVQRQKGRPKQQDHSKADLYSAGVRSDPVTSVPYFVD